MKIFTIGFTKKSAEKFFGLLQKADVERVVDVRLNNTSQLAAFSKAGDIEYFLETIGGIEYEHHPELAPTQNILDAFKKKGGSWSDYEREFNRLLEDRETERQVTPALLERACLLCSEHRPKHCHRRLIVEYLARKWKDIELDVEHLM